MPWRHLGGVQQARPAAASVSFDLQKLRTSTCLTPESRELRRSGWCTGKLSDRLQVPHQNGFQADEVRAVQIVTTV